MPNRTLPSPNIRKVLLDLLRAMPVETVHLRESGIGRIVNFFSQRPGEQDDIRRLSNELVTAWARPILLRASRRDDGGVEFTTMEDGEEGVRGSGRIIKSEALKTGVGRRFSGGSVETRQQRKISQSLAKKKARPSQF